MIVLDSDHHKLILVSGTMDGKILGKSTETPPLHQSKDWVRVPAMLYQILYKLVIHCCLAKYLHYMAGEQG